MITVEHRQAHYPRCPHRTYHMTCVQHQSLLDRAGCRCEMCGRPGGSDGAGLFLDHDHRLGWRAVRGLACPGCNSLMLSIDRGRRVPSVEILRYLESPWWREAGVDPIGCPPDCRYGHHKRSIPPVTEPGSTPVKAQVRADTFAVAVRRYRRWTAAERELAGDPALSTEEVARLTRRSYDAVHMARRSLGSRS